MKNAAIKLDQSELIELGQEQQSVLRAHDVFEDPEAVIEAAASAKFARINPHYPGVRAEVDPQLLQALCDGLGRVAKSAFGIDAPSWQGQAWYSIVTLSPDQLTPIQRLPHFDGFDPNQLAVMIYLNQSGHGGTNFYRHRSTGFEAVTEVRFPTYKAALEADIGATGLPPAAYIDDGAPTFARIRAFEPEFNSLIFYRGIALHSGAIRNDLPLSSDPRVGRLTLNGFFRPR
ncbi:MAG: DUF6445 family protein [Henriciella sp.]|nr:DUF6445 family protein [Henriciella sp.]